MLTGIKDTKVEALPILHGGGPIRIEQVPFIEHCFGDLLDNVAGHETMVSSGV
jgi:hypothetical protein